MISNEQSKALATAFSQSFPECGFDVESNVLSGWLEEQINALTKTPKESLTTQGAHPESNQVIAYVQTSARGDRNLFIKDDPRVEPFKRHGFTLVPLIDGEKAAIQINELDRKLDDCGAMIRQLVHKLRKAAPDNDLASKALDFLKRKGLQGSPLRANAPQPTLIAPLAGFYQEREHVKQGLVPAFSELVLHTPSDVPGEIDKERLRLLLEFACDETRMTAAYERVAQGIMAGTIKRRELPISVAQLHFHAWGEHFTVLLTQLLEQVAGVLILDGVQEIALSSFLDHLHEGVSVQQFVYALTQDPVMEPIARGLELSLTSGMNAHLFIEVIGQPSPAA